MVALRKESVDRNCHYCNDWPDFRLVALRKESVDRNIKADVSYNIQETSLSARRAWIEMFSSCYNCVFISSLSARRAWIEMLVRAAT